MSGERRTRSASSRPQAIVIDGRRIWTCDDCEAQDVWTDGWRWLGYYAIEGLGASAGEREVIERVSCPTCVKGNRSARAS